MDEKNRFIFLEGHELHSHLINHRYKTCYLNIPVNASCWGKRIFENCEFVYKIGNIPSDYKIIVFFRDPIDRFLSGISTWLTSRLSQHTSLEQVRDNTAFLDTIFDTVRQDEHTERQMFFIQDLDIDNMVPFFMKEDFKFTVTNYFVDNFNSDISGFAEEHVTTLEGGKLIPRNYFKQILVENWTYQERLKDFYIEDYYFLKSIKYINGNCPDLLGFDNQIS